MASDHKPTVAPIVTHACPSCGTGVRCDMARGKNLCWCFDERPQMRSAEFGGECLCKKCLTGKGKKS